MRAFALAVLTTAMLATACGTRAASGAPSSDTSYDRIEQLRDLRSTPVNPPDTTYDRIEELRTMRFIGQAADTSDDSYDKVEAHRLARWR